MRDTKHTTLPIFISLLVGLILMLVPLPNKVALWRPDFIVLVLIYWWLAHPERVGVIVGFFVGILIDVLYNTLMGQHAIGNVVIAWLVIKIYQRMRCLPPWQQSISIFGLLVIKYFFVFWVNRLHTQTNNQLLIYLAPCISSALIWPFVFNLLRKIRISARDKQHY